jgi:hypothetical protein
MNVTVDASGRVVEAEVVRPSRSRLLDQRRWPSCARGALRPLQHAMRQQADQIVITSRFRFTRDDGLETTLSTDERRPAPRAPAAMPPGTPVAPTVTPCSATRWRTAVALHPCRVRAPDRAALVYERLLCPLDGFAEAVRAFADGGGRGCNVTVPFKFEAPALAAQVTPRAALAQAANVLRFDAEGWLADNTDGVGLVRDIEQGAGVALAGRRVLLIGAGGAAAGVLGPLLEAARPSWCVANRTLDKATALVHRHIRWALRFGVALSAAALVGAGQASTS